MSAGDANKVQWMVRIEELLQALDDCSDPIARRTARELVQVMLEVHKAGLAKILQSIGNLAAGGFASPLPDLLQDEIVNSLLLVHNLHPDDLEMRVWNSVEQLRPFLQEHGFDVTIVGIAAGVVRLQCHGGNPDSTSLTRTLCRVLEETILANAPEIEAVQIEELRDTTICCSSRVMPLPLVENP